MTTKILTITSNDQGINYGPSVHYLELWNAIASLSRDYSILGVAPSWSGRDPIIPPKFPLVRTAVWGRSVRQVYWDFLCALRILTAQCDVIYVRASSFHIFSVLALRVRSVKLAVELNGAAKADGESGKEILIKTKLAEFGQRKLISRASVVFSVTQELVHHAKRISPDAMHVHVPNGVSSKFFRDPKRTSNIPRLTVIYVGTFTPWDGAYKIRDIAASFPSVRFLMVGDGESRSEIESQSPENMVFAGWVPYENLPDIYASADAAIVLYEKKRHEEIGGSPLKIREYIASSLPVFATTAKGTEVIEEFGVGLRSENISPEDFSRFLANLDLYLRNYDLNGQRIRRDISWDSAAVATMNAIDRLF